MIFCLIGFDRKPYQTSPAGSLMDYSLAREQIATGDLLLFRGRGLIARVIQRRTLSIYSHVGVAVWMEIAGIRRLVVIEAREFAGVRLFPLSLYLRQGHAIDWFRLVDDSVDPNSGAAWALERLGQSYASVWQLLRSFGFIGLAKRLADALGLPTKVDSERWFCSAFAAQYLLAAGWQPEEIVDPSLTPPGEIALFPCLQRQGILQPSPDAQ